MGKKSSSSSPSFSDGAFQINGVDYATVSKKGGVIKSNYKMSTAEKNLNNNIQTQLTNSINNLFKVSDATKENWNQQLKAYKNIGIQNINDIYKPMEKSLKNDIASRFGNLDNSAFLDNLQKITNNKAKAVSELSNNLILKRNDLYSQEMQNRINYINLLGNLQNNQQNKMFSYINQASLSSNSGNSYNNSSYNSSNSGGLLGLNLGTALGTAGNLISSTHPLIGTAMSALSFL